MNLDDLIESIECQFRGGPPNGWLLGWDESRCATLVSTAAAPHTTTNNTSFDYGFCNWFEVRIDNTNDDLFWTLTIKLSFIAPAFCVHWTQYDRSTQGTFIPMAPAGYREVEKKVCAALESVGFFEISDEWYNVKLHGIELELSSEEHVSIGKCLFSDFEE